MSQKDKMSQTDNTHLPKAKNQNGNSKIQPTSKIQKIKMNQKG